MTLSAIYAVAYNGFLVLGWSVVLWRSALSLLDYKENGLRTFYADVENSLKVSQTLAVLEIVHAALGLFSSGVFLTAFQVASRLFLLWGVTNLGGLPVQQHYGVVLMVLAWTITEIIRYSFYGLTVCNKLPYCLKWCRYSFFIVLYPVGVAGELLLIFKLMGMPKVTEMMSLRMPNKLNFAFDFYWFLWFVLLLYPIIFPQLYGHMFQQRRKKIGEQEKKTE
ncbi:very-long-chain (3R)-3-hydroxyacyl-CoA dehydratase 2-like [Corticium candelabrum]|uniref:very-long-chain (3R)-3-hydroxyacyl-CoA dehydratase 2-like n=1 Tax=Corticium candelabrum TaxID=121492 RepID=UPI002E26E66C|nr:very-long-chain (3R)-3-hydroxyacyl-CoA dehydratase 2-like [Corticium candelabrum]